MILLQCPYSGFRNVSEFVWQGEVLERPDPKTATRAEWRAYLYNRRAKSGRVQEMWFHRNGSRKFFIAERDTNTNEVYDVYKIDEADSAPETGETAAGDV
ncbi:sarcosine oxidase subunit delta [Micrococcoides hystricis]|uniref:Sarcosine oxidase subunit delta n=1 Tax=Micrococcoides hystricis TaxID=1572761 RepID=A0ABV6PA12_9MICC